MTVLAMRKVSLLASRADKDNIMQILQKNGLMHILDLNTDKPMICKEELERLNNILEVMKIFKPRSYDIPPKNISLSNTLEEISVLVEEYKELNITIENLQNILQKYTPFGEFNLNTSLVSSIKVSLKLGIFSKEEIATLVKEKIAFEIIKQEKQKIYVALFLQNNQKTSLNFFDPPELSVKEYKNQILESKQKLELVKNSLCRWSYQYSTVEKYVKEVRENYDRLLESQKAYEEDKLFGISGFILKSCEKEFKNSLINYTVALQIEDPKAGDNVPVLLNTTFFAKGFQTILRSFSGISYFEKDKTSLISILFMFFGGLCLMDAGYGVLLFISGYILYLKNQVNIGQVFMWTGGFSTILGFFCGQVFGLLVSKDIFIHHTPIFDLATDPLSCFKFSIIVGVFIMMLCNLVVLIESGIKSNALGNFLVILAGVCFAVSSLEFVDENSSFILQNSSYGLIALSVFSWLLFPDQVFGENKHIANVLWTLYSGPVSIIQDILSHMRLFGIALSGSILAMVINKIISLMPFLLASIFAPIAHFAVFLLSILSLYIHTNRLIFLEFGTKCIKGGNNYFNPFFRRI
jgi:V/A-type H+-transporting ATPase subunit I